MQSQNWSVGKLKKREILLLIKKLHYSRSARIKKFAFFINSIVFRRKCRNLIVTISNASYFKSIQGVQRFLSKNKYSTCKQYLLHNIHICVYEVISCKCSTLYVFIKKKYLKYQLIRMLATYMHHIWVCLILITLTERWYWKESGT